MTTNVEHFTIKKIEVNRHYQEAISGLGNPVGQAENQQNQLPGKSTLMLEAAYLGKVIVAPSTLRQSLIQALWMPLQKFEDEEDGIEKVMFIHPAQEATMLLDEQFTSADKFNSGGCGEWCDW